MRKRLTDTGWLMRIAVGVFAVGLGCAAAVLLPFFFGVADAPWWLALAVMLCPLGLLLGAVSLWREHRASRRRLLLAAAALERT